MVRRGFTLLTLLVMLASFLVLLGLLFPLVREARDTATRAAKAKNLMNLGIATHNYHDVNGFFPPGCDANSFSATAYLMPYLEQDQVYRRIDFTRSIDDKAN